MRKRDLDPLTGLGSNGKFLRCEGVGFVALRP